MMGISYHLVIGLTLLPLLLGGIAISDTSGAINTPRQTKSRLWFLDANDDEDVPQTKNNIIYEKLEQYAIYCCEHVIGGSKTCTTRQMAFWAYIPDADKLNENEIRLFLETQFNPEFFPKEHRERMCGHAPANDNELDWPLYATPIFSDNENEPDIHAERILLPQMAARAGNNNNEKFYFYIWTRKSPCAGTVNTFNDCTTAMFDYTRQYIYNNGNGNWISGHMHTMNVGFSKWFIPNGIAPTDAKRIQSRRNFCDKVLFFKLETKSPNYQNGLQFHKIEAETFADRDYDDKQFDKDLNDFFVGPNQRDC